MTFWNLFALLAILNSCRGDRNIMLPLFQDPVTSSVGVSAMVRGSRHSYATSVCTLSWRSMVRVDPDDVADDLTIILESSNIRFVEPAPVYLVGDSLLRELGMGPGNAMLEMFSPISFLRNLSGPFSLILNSTDEFFYNNCVPESLVAARYTNSISGPRLQGSVSMTNREVQSHDDELIFNYISGNILMLLPVDFYNQLMSSILAAGMTQLPGSSGRFTNCEILPQSLSLRIAIRIPDTSFANIIVKPEDYLEKIPGSDHCRFKVTPNCQRAIFLNPLMLPGLSVRDHRDRLLEFCDTSI
jgi:hypothetical protein